MMMKEKIILYTDGGARGNPGPAGAGVLITDSWGKVLSEDSRPLGTMTNNEAEYSAVIIGLQLLKKNLGGARLKSAEVELRLDSQLVARQLSGEYQIKEERLQPFFIKVWNWQIAHQRLRISYIPRAENKPADALANQAMDKQTGSTGLFAG
ncbi:MAG: ribonuclease HI family protein [Candidatus Paceibacterota bacterium]